MKQPSLLLVLLLFRSALPANAQVLTLNEAIASATKENRNVEQSALDVAKAKEAIAEAKTARRPQLSANVLAGESLTPIDFNIPKGALGVYPNIGAIPAQSANISTPQNLNAFLFLSAAQPLTQLRKIGLVVQEASVSQSLAEESLRQIKQDTTHRVKDAYYQIVETQAQIASVEESVKYLTELSALTDRNLAEQTVLRSDSLQVNAKLSQQRYNLLVLEDTLASQKEMMNRLLGRELSTDFTVEQQAAPTPEEVNIAAARKEAAERRSEIQEARLQTKKTALDVLRERAEYMPDVSLQLSYISAPNISFAPKNILSAGFLLQWQPFDWGQKKHKLQELKISSKQATLTEQDAEQQVMLDVNQKFRKLMEARAFLDTQALVQETEREKLRVLMNQYQEKAVLLADLLQQQASVAQADGQYRQALAAFWSAKGDFDYALGRD